MAPRAAFVWLLLLAGSHPAVAQKGAVTSEEVTDRVTLDWYHAAGDVHRGSSPIPFHASLSNPTGEDRIVRLSGSWEGFQGEISRRIEMPAGTRKELDLYLGPAGYTHQFQVVLSSDAGAVIEDVQLSSVPLSPEQLAIALLSRHPMGWGTLRRSGDLAGRVVHLEPARLPGSAAGLATFDLLIWPQPEPWALRAEQLQGLVRWVEGGGHLVLAGAFTDRHALEPWTRIDVAEPRAVSELASLSGGAGSPSVRFRQPLAVTPLVVSADRIWLRETWGAIAAETRLGLGSVTVLGFDPTAPQIAGWPGLSAFWLRLLERRELAARRGAATSGSGWYPYVDDKLRSVARSLLTAERGGVALPITTLGLVLLLYLLAIGPGEYLWLRRWQRLEWTWLSFPLWVGLFSVGAYAVATRTRSDVDLVRHILVRDLPPAAESFRDELHTSIFATRPETYRLVPRAPSARPIVHNDPFAAQRVYHHIASLGSPTLWGPSLRSGTLHVNPGWSSSIYLGGPPASAFATTYEQGPAAIASRVPKWSFLAGSFEGHAPRDGARLETRVAWPDRLAPAGRIIPHLGVDLAGAWLLFADAGKPYHVALEPRRDGLPVALGSRAAAVTFDTGSLAQVQAGDPVPLDRFVFFLAAQTVERLLLANPPSGPFTRQATQWLADYSHPRPDWSQLLQAGGGVFIGWTPDAQPRLQGEDGSRGLLVFRIGLSPERLRPPGSGPASLARATS